MLCHEVARVCSFSLKNIKHCFLRDGVFVLGILFHNTSPEFLNIRY
jgi:hypothetical protein